MAFPKLVDWKAPWELKDEEFDEESARKYIYDLASDKDKLQGKVTAANTERDSAKAEVTTAKAELTTSKTELEAAQAKGNETVVADLQGKLKVSEEKLKTAET